LYTCLRNRVIALTLTVAKLADSYGKNILSPRSCPFYLGNGLFPIFLGFYIPLGVGIANQTMGVFFFSAAQLPLTVAQFRMAVGLTFLNLTD
jgi:hypothetical protein